MQKDRLGSKTEVGNHNSDVRYASESGSRETPAPLPLGAITGSLETPVALPFGAWTGHAIVRITGRKLAVQNRSGALAEWRQLVV